MSLTAKKRQRRVNLVEAASRRGGGGSGEFHYDHATKKSYWGLAPPGPPAITLSCHRTGRKFVYEDGTSTWAEEEEDNNKQQQQPLAHFPLSSDYTRVLCQPYNHTGEAFIFDPVQMQSFPVPPPPPPVVVAVAPSPLPITPPPPPPPAAPLTVTTMSEHTQGELASAVQFVFGVLHRRSFLLPGIDVIEYAFAHPDGNTALRVLAVLHQALVLSSPAEFEAWHKDEAGFDADEWVRRGLQQHPAAHKFLVPSLTSAASYVDLSCAARVRILGVLGKWKEEEEKIEEEVFYRGERLGSTASGADVIWYFAHIAPHRLYASACGSSTSRQWRVLSRTRQELVQRAEAMLASSGGVGELATNLRALLLVQQQQHLAPQASSSAPAAPAVASSQEGDEASTGVSVPSLPVETYNEPVSSLDTLPTPVKSSSGSSGGSHVPSSSSQSQSPVVAAVSSPAVAAVVQRLSFVQEEEQSPSSQQQSSSSSSVAATAVAVVPFEPLPSTQRADSSPDDDDAPPLQQQQQVMTQAPSSGSGSSSSSQ